MRKRIEGILEERGVALVVFMDDIDRLDRAEVHAVLKLVKLVAGFRGVTYVLAFDDELIAAAIGDEYGAGGSEAGRSFLEKIVQVPLRLPRVDATTALNITLGEVDRALRLAEIEASQEDAMAFRRYFDPIFESRARTLRTGKRYGNALLFALPLLKGEVNVADLLLLEGIRALAPTVHAALPEYQELLLGSPASMSWHGDGQKRRDEERRQWDNLLALTEVDQRKAVGDALEHLFPNVARFTRNTHYTGEWFTRWSREQRAASSYYFDRYFQYAVPPNDVSDVSLDEFVVRLGAGDCSGVLSIYDALCTNTTADRFVEKLRIREQNMTAGHAATLIRVLAARGSALPRPRSMLGMHGPHAQAAVLALRAMRRVKPADRFALARLLVDTPVDLLFATECFRWLRHSKDESDDKPRLLTKEEEDALRNILKGRLNETIRVQPFYLREADVGGQLLRWWGLLSDEGTTQAFLRDRLVLHPSDAIPLLAAMAGQPWSMETGLPLAPRIEREEYDSIARLVDPADVIAALRRIYGDVIDPVPEENTLDDADDIDVKEMLSVEQRFARRFVWLHQKVTELSSKQQVAENSKPAETVQDNAADQPQSAVQDAPRSTEG